MDFLGLRTLDLWGMPQKLIKANRGIDLDLDAIPLDDKAACDILTKATPLVYSSLNRKVLQSL